MRPATVIVLFLLTAAGCAHRAGSPTYRYVKQDNAPILIPPGVTGPAVTQRTFVFRTAVRGTPKCALSENGVELQPRRRDLQVTVNRQALLAAPPGWLATWTGSIEKRGCLAANEAGTLASRIAESLPIDPAAANLMLHPDVLRGGYVDLGPYHRLKVVSPIFREGTPTGSPVLETATAQTVAGDNRALTVEIKSSGNFLGYETAWWSVEPKPDPSGVTFTAGPAVTRIGDKTTEGAQPRFNYFQFAEGAAFFRLFFLTRLTRADHDIAILSARTRAELDEETRKLQENSDTCGTLQARCVLVPKEVAVVPHIAVTVNGKEVAVLAGSRVRDAVLAGGEKNMVQVLPTLTIQRLYAGAPTPVDFNRSTPDVLDLPLNGGEAIKW